MAKSVNPNKQKKSSKPADAAKQKAEQKAEQNNATQGQQGQQSQQAQESPLQWFHASLLRYQVKILPRLLQPHNIPVEQFVQVIVNEVKNEPKLLIAARANPSSMFASVLLCAEIGLSPNSDFGEFYFIPRNLKQSDNTKKLTVCPLIGYKGIVKLLYRSGNIKKIDSRVVYEGDEFEYEYGLNEKLKHVENHSVPRTADKIKFVYAICTNKYDEKQFEVLSAEQIKAIMNISPYQNDLYFNDDKGVMRWMEKKTVLLQLSKLLEKDYYSQRAIEADMGIEGGAVLSLGENNEVKLIQTSPTQFSRFRDIGGNLSWLAQQAKESKDESRGKS